MKYLCVALSLGLAAPAMAESPAMPALAATKQALDPQRLALAKVTVNSIWPLGTYQRMMKDMMTNMQDGIMDRILDSTAADLGIESEEDDSKTLRDKIVEKDPNFEERMRITNQVMSDEMIQVFTKMEPKLREGLANAYARRFTVTELTEINRFFGSPAGSSYARQSMELFTDKEFVAEMMAAGPAMVKEMPTIIEKLKKATAHLPPPPGSENEEADEVEEEGAAPVA
jgi:hypothetical protein